MNDSGKGDSQFTIVSFLVRFLAALALVLLTYNPTHYCFVHWLRSAITDGEAGAVHALAGVVLLIGWTVFVRATLASLGMLGLILGAAFLAAAIWVLVDYDVLRIDSGSTVTWIILACVAALLATGMSWGHWKRQASGQVEVDEVGR